MTHTRKRGGLGGRGGVKVGDFGTGGRVYERDYTRPAGSGQCSPQSYGISSCLCFFIPLIVLAMTERTLYLTAGSVDEASESAVLLESPIAVDDNEGSLVFLQTDPRHPPKLNGKPPADTYFNFEMPPNSGIGKRVTEYCQWQEFRHSRSKKTGTDRDGNDKYTEEIWYTYHKAWRSKRINSLFFDNAAAYHNPQRDPAPSKTVVAPEGIDLSGKASSIVGLSIGSVDMEPAMQNWKQVPIYKDGTLKVSNTALNAGFTQADHRFFYSRQPKGGWNSPLFKAGVSYLVDGVLDVGSIASATGVESLLKGAGLDWITKGTCDAGDVRVHFESKQLPVSASLVGLQMNKNLIPNRFSNGAERMFVRSGLMNMDALLSLCLSDDTFWQNVYRFGLFLCVVVAGCLLECGLATGSGDSPNLLHGGTLGMLVYTLLLSIMTIFFYGVDDSYVAIGVTVLSAAGLLFMFSSGGGGEKKIN